MGLDQYAYAVAPEALPLATSKIELTDEQLEQLEANRAHLQTWRKHADLNAWMENLWFEKGNDQEFNCEPLILEREDLEALAEHIEAHGGYAEKGEGFFWGETTEEDVESDRAFIKSALAAIDEGMVVYYYCWW